MFWLIAAAALLIIELFAGTVYLMVLSAALAGAALVDWLGGGFSASLLTASVLAAAGIWQVRRILRARRDAGSSEAIQNDLDIGQTVQIVRHLHTDVYEVFYRGTHWQAQAANYNISTAAQTGVITGRHGNLLLIHLH